MRIEKNITVFAKEAQKDGSNQEKNKKTIFAGDLKGDFTLQDRIQQKKEEAKKQAMKIVGDAWNSDRAIDDDLNCRRQHIKELGQQNKEIQTELKDIEKQKQDLKEVYGVTDDDIEQKETGLYGETTALEPSEYQQRLKELDELGKNKQAQLQKNEQEIIVENAVIRGTRLERLKKSPMLEAAEQAEEIMDAASDEIIGMVTEDAKEHLDEEQAEREEQAEAIKEKRQEQEEILEKRQERKEEMEELTEALPVDEILKLENARTDVQQEIQNIVDKMKLIAEDIKGSMVDTSI